jgi:hypothetical protein
MLGMILRLRDLIGLIGGHQLRACRRPYGRKLSVPSLGATFGLHCGKAFERQRLPWRRAIQFLGRLPETTFGVDYASRKMQPAWNQRLTNPGCHLYGR